MSETHSARRSVWDKSVQAIEAELSSGRDLDTDEGRALLQSAQDAEAQCRAQADPRIAELIATLRQAHTLATTHGGELHAIFGHRAATSVGSAISDAIKKIEALQLEPRSATEVEAELGQAVFLLALRLGPTALWHRWQSAIPGLTVPNRAQRRAHGKKRGSLQ